jgi:hypothetical protein
MAWDDFMQTIIRCDTFSRAMALSRNRLKKKEVKNFLAGMNGLYEAIGRTSNSDTIVDSSRNPFVALFMLHNRPEAKVLYLTRNGEDSLYSKLHRMESGKGFRWYRFHFNSPRWYMPFLMLNGVS